MNRITSYENEPTFITNISKNEITMILQVAAQVDVFVYTEEAFDIHGKMIPGCVSVHSCKSDEEKRKFFDALLQTRNPNV